MEVIGTGDGVGGNKNKPDYSTLVNAPSNFTQYRGADTPIQSKIEDL